jgi:hypothetical protein
VSPNGKAVISTWQGAVKKIKTKEGRRWCKRRLTLLLDEAHIGTAGKGGEDGVDSIRRVRDYFKFKYEIYLSATIAKIRGKDHLRDDMNDKNTVPYLFDRATKDGTINPVDIIVGYTGREVELKVLEDAVGMDAHDFMEKLENGNFVYRAGEDETPTDQAQNMIERRIRLPVRSFRGTLPPEEEKIWFKFFDNRVRGALDLCFDTERPYINDTWQSLWFMPRIRDAERALPTIRQAWLLEAKRAKLKEYSVDDVQVVHSNQGVGEAQELTRRFKNGEIKIAIAVGMMTEGTDIPTLECCVNLGSANDAAKLLQKLGRIVRIPKPPIAKAPVSRFYEIKDAPKELRLCGRRNLKTDAIEEVFKEGISDPNLRKAVAVAAINRESLLDAPGVRTVAGDDSVGRDMEIPSDPTIKYVEEVHSSNEIRKQTKGIENTIRDAAGGGKPKAKMVSVGFRFCVEKVSGSKKAYITNTLDIVGYAGSKDSTAKKAALLDPRLVKKPNKTTNKTLWLAFHHYTKPSQTYDEQFTRQLEKAKPHWFERSAEIKKENYLSLARKGGKKPTVRDEPCLFSYISPSSGCFDPEFTKSLRAERPDWFHDDVADNKRLLLEMAEAGEPRPPIRTPIGKRLQEYTYERPRSSFDAAFNKQVRDLRPDWFDPKIISANRIAASMASWRKKIKAVMREDGALFSSLRAAADFMGVSRSAINNAITLKPAYNPNALTAANAPPAPRASALNLPPKRPNAPACSTTWSGG